MPSFPRQHRLSGKVAFSAVYDAKTKVAAGPLVVFSLPNGLDHPRLGLSVSRKVGIAPKRTRIKRLIREVFRNRPDESTSGYDWVVVVRPHETMVIEEYRRHLFAAASRLIERQISHRDAEPQGKKNT